MGLKENSIFIRLWKSNYTIGLIHDSHHDGFSIVMQISHALIQGAQIEQKLLMTKIGSIKMVNFDGK